MPNLAKIWQKVLKLVYKDFKKVLMNSFKCILDPFWIWLYVKAAFYLNQSPALGTMEKGCRKLPIPDME